MEIIKDKKTALLFGATGLVGGHCLRQLLEHPAYQEVVAFTRRAPSDIQHPKLRWRLIDFERLPQLGRLIKGHDLFVCLGTTLAKAGSRKAFFQVDYTYPYQIARLASENGVHQLLLISSALANPDASLLFPKVKGLLEQSVRQIPFWAVHLFQPSFLVGERQESRPAEQLATRLTKGLDFLTGGGMLNKYKPVEAEAVARAMLKVAQRLEGGVHVYPSHVIAALGGQT